MIINPKVAKCTHPTILFPIRARIYKRLRSPVYVAGARICKPFKEPRNRFRQSMWPEPVYANHLRSPEIDSRPGGINSSESIPGSLNVYKYGLGRAGATTLFVYTFGLWSVDISPKDDVTVILLRGISFPCSLGTDIDPKWSDRILIFIVCVA